mgnify:CR=1 FL=1
MKKKNVTHAAVQAAIKKFLKEGGKIQKLEEDNSGDDFKQRVEQADIRINQGQRKHPKIDPVPYENPHGWRAH